MVDILSYIVEFRNGASGLHVITYQHHYGNGPQAVK